MSGITNSDPISNGSDRPLTESQKGSRHPEKTTEQTEKPTRCAEAILKRLGFTHSEKPLTSDRLAKMAATIEPDTNLINNDSTDKMAIAAYLLKTEKNFNQADFQNIVQRISKGAEGFFTQHELSALRKYQHRLERQQNGREFLNHHFTKETVDKYIKEYFSSYSQNIDKNDPLIIKTLATVLRRVNYCNQNPTDKVNQKILNRCLKQLKEINNQNLPTLNKDERMALRKQILAVNRELYKMDLRPQKGWRWHVSRVQNNISDKIAQAANCLVTITRCFKYFKKTTKTASYQTSINSASIPLDLGENPQQKYERSKSELEKENTTLRLVAFLGSPNTDEARFQIKKIFEKDGKKHLEIELDDLKYYATIDQNQHIELSSTPIITDTVTSPELITGEDKRNILDKLRHFAQTSYIENALTREAKVNRYLFQYQGGTPIQADKNSELVTAQVQVLVPQENSTAQLLLKQLLSQTGKASATAFFSSDHSHIRQVQEELMENHFSVTKKGNIIEVTSPLELGAVGDQDFVLSKIIRVKQTMDITDVNDPKLSLDITFEDPNSAENLLYRAKKRCEKEKDQLEKEFQIARLFPLISDATTDLTQPPLEIQEIGVSSDDPNQKAFEISWNGFIFYAKYNETTQQMSVQQIEERIERHNDPVSWNPTTRDQFIQLLREAARKYTEEVLKKDLVRSTYIFLADEREILQIKPKKDGTERALNTISNFIKEGTASEQLLKYLLHQQAQSPTANLLAKTPPIIYSDSKIVLWTISDSSKPTYTVSKSKDNQTITITTHLKLLNAPGEKHLADVVTKQTMDISDIHNPKLSWEIEFHDRKEATESDQVD